MNASRARATLFALAALFGLWATAATSQGFAGLGADAQGFALPERRALTFPQDHAAHPEFRIEWWYLTATLTAQDGTPMGLQWTLFRSARAPDDTPGWQSAQTWMGHAALTTPDQHFVAERFARGGIGQAGATLSPFAAWIDDWRFAGDNDWQEMTLSARGDAFAYDVTLKAKGPLVAHGAAGYSVKSASGQASHYYSQPAFALSGTVQLPSGPVEVTGQAWVDREWSSQPLQDTQTGWDWFSLSFDTGDKLMGFGLREGADRGFSSGTWIGADGRVTPFGDGAMTLIPQAETSIANRRIPTTWRLRLPERDVDVTVRALNPAAWMPTVFPYWEGPVDVSGSHSGRGYLEMTGYPEETGK